MSAMRGRGCYLKAHNGGNPGWMFATGRGKSVSGRVAAVCRLNARRHCVIGVQVPGLGRKRRDAVMAIKNGGYSANGMTTSGALCDLTVAKAPEEKHNKAGDLSEKSILVLASGLEGGV
jgi:hypothetical protein